MVTLEPEYHDDTHEEDVEQLVGSVEEPGTYGTVRVEIGNEAHGCDETAEDEQSQLEGLTDRVQDYVVGKDGQRCGHDAVTNEGDGISLGGVCFHLLKLGLGLVAIAVETDPGVVEQVTVPEGAQSEGNYGGCEDGEGIEGDQTYKDLNL